MVDRQKTKAMAKKKRKSRKKNSLSIEDNGYYNSDIYNTDPDQNNGLNYPVKDLNRKSLVPLHWVNLYLVLLLAKKIFLGKSFQIFSYFVFWWGCSLCMKV